MGTDFKLLEFELYGQLLKAKELLDSLPGSGPMAAKLEEELELLKAAFRGLSREVSELKKAQ